MIQEITIRNYKSIRDLTLELGHLNVFIGDNGCGKTNILEAVGMVEHGESQIHAEVLETKGIRVCDPKQMVGAFREGSPSKAIEIGIRFEGNATKGEWVIVPFSAKAGNQDWKHKKSGFNQLLAPIKDSLNRLEESIKQTPLEAENDADQKASQAQAKKQLEKGLREIIAMTNRCMAMNSYVIFRPEEQALRGLRQESDAVPLGIHGERLPMVMGMLDENRWDELVDCLKYFPTVARIEASTDHLPTKKGREPDAEETQLLFWDKTMTEGNDCYSHETAAEGILHFLFCMTLMISDETPPIFAIDNFGNALNPKLCRLLIQEMAALAVKHEKQVLITTHNPAVLDGMNLFDDAQRLFVVGRSDEGDTRARRIQLKPEVEGKDLKLSEMWMRGYLGGLPDF